MLLGDVKLPSINTDEMGTQQKLQAIYEYMVQLTKQINYVLQNLDEGNLSSSLKETIGEIASGAGNVENLVTRGEFSTYTTQTAAEISSKADAETVDGQFQTMQTQTANAIAQKADAKLNGVTLWSLAQTTAKGISLIASEEIANGTASTTSVKISPDGMHVDTGGTFTVESGNFSLDGDGNLSASGATINGDILQNGQPVLTPLDIYVGTEAPATKRAGMIWIRPKQSSTPTAAQTTHSYTYARDRLSLKTYPINGTLTGSAAAAVGTNYSYEIRIPVYASKTAVSGATLSITIGGVTFSTTVDCPSYTTTVVVIEASKSTWLGNQSSLSFTLTASNANLLNPRSGIYSIQMVSRSRE